MDFVLLEPTSLQVSLILPEALQMLVEIDHPLADLVLNV
jgi:hypothetical protein